MSGEDDLRAAVASALRQHMDRGSSGRLIADYGIDASDLADAALDAIRLATPAEPARESDGVGLREDERNEVWMALPDNITDSQSRRVYAAVERIIADRVAEAGARAVDMPTDDAIDGLVLAIRDAARGGCGSHQGCRDLIAKKQRDAARRWLRDRARGLGGAS